MAGNAATCQKSNGAWIHGTSLKVGKAVFDRALLLIFFDNLKTAQSANGFAIQLIGESVFFFKFLVLNTFLQSPLIADNVVCADKPPSPKKGPNRPERTKLI